MKKLLSITLLTLVAIATFTSPAFAQELLRDNSCLYQGIPTMNCIMPLFANAVYWLILLSGSVALFLIMYGGFRFLTSGGDPKNLDGARKTITWSVVGLIVIILSFMIVNVIADLTGVNCITRFGFTACGTQDECAFGQPNGYCPTGQVCVHDGGQIYQCRNACSTEHPSGYCPDKQKCINIGNQTYTCQYECSAKNPNGYCTGTNAKCVRLDSGIYDCRVPCNLAEKSTGYCEGGKTCTKTTTPYSVTYWICK
jgi:hypothetical protein